jgi:hypothetical protein
LQNRDPTGNLYVANKEDIPFQINRVFWIDELEHSRGSHALKKCEQVIVAITGEFSIDVYHRNSFITTFRLRSPDQGLYLPPMSWRVMKQFWPESSAMVFCSHPFDLDDYIQDFDEFLEAVK